MKQIILILTLLISVNAEKVLVEKVTLTGARKTKLQTIKRIAKLDSIPGSYHPDTVKQRILNRQLFSDVSLSYDSTDKNLQISLRDSWTIQPIFSGRKSAGELSFRVGLYDINFLGRDMVVGGHYDNYANSNNFQLSFRKVNLGPKRVTLGILGQHVTSNYIWYNDFRKPEAGFQAAKNRISLYGQLPFLIKGREFTAGLSLDGLIQTTGTEEIADTLKTLNSENGYYFEDTVRGLMPSLSLQYSTININRYIVDGWAAKIAVVRSVLHDRRDYSSLSIYGQYYKKLPFHSNICVNGEVKGLNGSSTTSLYYIGHSSGIRGFRNSEFRGKAYAQLNSELRIGQIDFKLLKRYEFIIQPALFCDLLSVGERPSSFFETNKTVSSIGGGIRFVSPSISGFMLNADVAIALGDYATRGGNSRYNYYVGTSYYFTPIR